jgi:hypothetical protein
MAELDGFERDIALSRHRLLMLLASLDWPGFEAEAARLEQRLLATAPGDWWRVEVSRRLSTDRLLGAVHHRLDWRVVEGLWDERRRRGFSSLLDEQGVLAQLVTTACRPEGARGRPDLMAALEDFEARVRVQEEHGTRSANTVAAAERRRATHRRWRHERLGQHESVTGSAAA